ncbi:MAG: 2-hydroxy-6-oxononadienedioate/2-hydroxy-6-oxononatrienedioate hydrolase-like [Puniceicoccaceae bacterium 5H]|nr:MAG: 2-hydroxy-6-oxononadienedioate/2-hydroxy-6-oxononatrienedioate hydrolase-like [Puniceicoccaceae bacterium 5H]
MPVVLIHGTPSSSHIWRDVAPTIATAGYRVHTYDLLGFGASERPWNPAVDTSVSGQVPILQQLMAHWKIEKAHVVAHDIGGGIAQRFALQYPEEVRSLTLIDSVSFDSWPSTRTRKQMEAGLETLIKAPDAAHRAHFREWLLSAVYHKERFAAGALDHFLNIISGPVGQSSLFQHQVAHYDPRHTTEIVPRLTELADLPVQILWGEDDTWQKSAWADKLQSAIPHARLHILPECGHFAMEDQPAAISQYLLSFFNGLASSNQA